MPPQPTVHRDAVRTGRAAPLSPDERRAAILRAAVPLLLERGTDVTTRDLAAAAGVAEGTLFRVFPDKPALVRAAVLAALDPSELVADLARLPHGDLRTTLTRAADLALERGRTVSALLMVVHELPGPVERPGPHHRHDVPHNPVEPVIAAVGALLEPFAGELRCAPTDCARLVVALAMTVARPGGHGLTLSAEELVATLLDGVLVRPTSTAATLSTATTSAPATTTPAPEPSC